MWQHSYCIDQNTAGIGHKWMVSSSGWYFWWKGIGNSNENGGKNGAMGQQRRMKKISVWLLVSSDARFAFHQFCWLLDPEIGKLYFSSKKRKDGHRLSKLPGFGCFFHSSPAEKGGLKNLLNALWGPVRAPTAQQVQPSLHVLVQRKLPAGSPQTWSPPLSARGPDSFQGFISGASGPGELSCSMVPLTMEVTKTSARFPEVFMRILACC